MLSMFKEILQQMRQVLTLLMSCLVLWQRVLWKLAVRPKGFGKLTQIEETWVMGKQIFTYSLGLLKPEDPSVAKQRLTVTVDGEKTHEYECSPDTTAFKFEAGPVGANVKVSLDYLDASGNDSANVELEFQIVDTLAPAAPTGFGTLQQVAERYEPGPEDAPPADGGSTDGAGDGTPADGTADGSQTTES